MFIYLSLFLVSSVSGALILFRPFEKKKRVSLLLSFSGAYLLGICFLHLLPELFAEHNHSIGLYLLIGFFLQLILDYFSGGIEHGHGHVNRKRLRKFPILVFLSLGLHSFLEALPIQQLGIIDNSHNYLYGILVHKIPIAFVFASLLVAYELKRSYIILGIILFSITAPLGAFIGNHLEAGSVLFERFLALSVGIILHLSTTIILESSEEHSIDLSKLVPMLLGGALALLSLVPH